MNKLVQLIEATRAKLDVLRRHALKETPTRTIVIDPLLEALGWDVRDPDEVQLEYPTVDGKSVDYGLKLNRKCVLFVEAKALEDPLTDVKAITQVVNYANSGGIVWCILTNGLTWKVYRSIENCPAPDKLMYEVSIDPRDSEGMLVSDIARQMWRFSREEIAKGTLDRLGEQTFMDGKVRKALDKIMAAAPRPLLKIVRESMGDQTITPQQIKESLSRIWRRSAVGGLIAAGVSPGMDMSVGEPIEAPKKARRIRRATKSESPYNEAHHLAGKPKEAVELYRAVDRLCLSLGSDDITKRYLAKCIAYHRGKRGFCSIHIQKSGLRVWLQLKYSRVPNPPAFSRDVSNVAHWGSGNFELAISGLPQLEQAAPLIRDSFEACGR